MAKAIKSKVVWSILALFIIFISFTAHSIWAFGEKNDLVYADAAIVLGTAVIGDEPTPALKERINHSVWLYENDFVDKIIFTGGRTNGELLAESEVSRSYALTQNVPAEDIYIETESLVTVENFLYASEIGKEHDLTSFLVVSDPLHMKRALLMADRSGIEAYSSPTTTSAYNTAASITPFFLREVICYIGYKAIFAFS